MFRFIPDNLNLPVMKFHKIFFAVSVVLIVVSLSAFFTRGLNLGIDFLGGTLIEAETHAPADLADLRTRTSALQLGEVSLQTFGADDIILLRIQNQGDEATNITAIQKVKDVLSQQVKEYRRTESVGPTIGAELRTAAMWAVGLAMLAMLIYIWFRFEWQFGLAALLALSHDVITTIGLFAILSLEFNLATVAALLTIAGYSINDTVVVFDRARENLQKYRKLELSDLLNMSINQTFARTFMTSFTTLIAVLGLAIFGGSIIHDFAFAMAWGVLIGTYSSIGLASPLLMYMRLHRGEDGEEEA